MIQDDPEVVAEVTAAFHEYERALMADEVAAMDRLFHDAPSTVRYGVGEVLYGADEIRAFRKGRGGSPQRRLGRVAIHGYGRDFATADAEFFRDGSERRGRQSQAWVRFADGWKVVSAHVSIEGDDVVSALFEHSLWVEARADARPGSGDRHADLMAVVHDATLDERLALIRAHPELAGKAAVDRTLTEASAAEQASAGLDRLTPEEFARFHELNAAYAERFAMPFIVCVRRTDKAGILAAMARRLGNDRETEIATAIEEIGHIVRLRLGDTA